MFIVGGGNYIEYQNLMDYSKVGILLETNSKLAGYGMLLPNLGVYSFNNFEKISQVISTNHCLLFRGTLAQRNCCMEPVK